MADRPTGFWGTVRRWASGADSESQRERAAAGCTPVSEISDRERARVRGTLQTVTLQPRAGMPALEAELYDGSGVVTLVWLGRRRITGIDCGRRLVASGRVASVEGRRLMYNPQYRLLPAGAA
ncbi:MAG: OB-fold nucleic acid binding domain-containing protein [Actinomycetota bacterium]